MPRKRPKSLDAPVVMEARRLEAWAYCRADEWKRKYRYTLVQEFRTCISRAKDFIIEGFELPNRYRTAKMERYTAAQLELAKAEGKMDLMVADEIGVMSAKEWSECAIRLDEIRAGLSRLVNSLNKGVGGSESLNCGTGSVSADYKDV